MYSRSPSIKTTRLALRFRPFGSQAVTSANDHPQYLRYVAYPVDLGYVYHVVAMPGLMGLISCLTPCVGGEASWSVDVLAAQAVICAGAPSFHHHEESHDESTARQRGPQSRHSYKPGRLFRIAARRLPHSQGQTKPVRPASFEQRTQRSSLRQKMPSGIRKASALPDHRVLRWQTSTAADPHGTLHLELPESTDKRTALRRFL